MNEIKQQVKPHIQKILDNIDSQIALHKQAIEELNFSRNMWVEHQPEEVKLMPVNSPLTRDLIRNFLKGYTQPIQTVKIIDLIYSNKSEEERKKLIKHLSVMFNQMEKEGEVIIEKQKGVKGNFYKWNTEK